MFVEKIRNWVETPSLSNNFILSLKFYRTKEEEGRGVTATGWKLFQLVDVLPVNYQVSVKIAQKREGRNPSNASKFVQATSLKFFFIFEKTHNSQQHRLFSSRHIHMILRNSPIRSQPHIE